MTPLLDRFAPDAPLFVRVCDGEVHAFSAARCAGAADALAAVLPPARYTIQCCVDTLELALGTLAAWRAGQTVVMPSTRLAADLDGLRQRFADSYVLDTAAFGAAVQRAMPPRTATASTSASASAFACTSAPQAADGDAACRLLAAAAPRWPAFGLDPAHEAIVLFTSGSTREPRPQAKTWDALVRGAETFRRAFAPLTRPPLLMGTVDCHHMFGLEANLMAALHCGYALCANRPQLPRDLADLLACSALHEIGRLWLVTTPLQLSTFYRAGMAVSGIERVIVATMPMAQALAVGVEAQWRTQLDEIYGNTECGVMATRRTAVRSAFDPAPGIEFRFLGDDTASVARVPDPPALLDDRVAPCAGATGRFELLGRRADMVKVGGKRTTLRALDDHLAAIDGVVDGAFLMDDAGNGRVSAVVVAPSHTPASLLAELARRIDPAFMPRPLLFTDTLPRDAQGKLPRAELLRVAAGLTRSARPIEQRHVFASSHPAFAGHFPGNPIVPGALLLAELEGLLGANGYRVIACDHAKFLAPVVPDEPCTMRIECADLSRVTFEIAAGDHVSMRGVFRCERASAGALSGQSP